ncbi:CPBP family glutamic-type intramembrane protease [Microbulbifer yueqingensis]|uniref:CPBP family glutamic-type intramembrane protease n=1 Tax=Microbulbifer yueqingensis TaxID=658219 RepID=UPI001114655B|nr:CPBP family glutamic-type intramembrane protease [Microbulbifer yueqingensis]
MISIEADYDLDMADAFRFIIVAPLIEAMLLALLLNILVKFGLDHWLACMVSAVVWGFVHGLIEPVKFVGTIWSFFIFSFSYLWWLEVSKKKAFIAGLLPHVAINIVVVLMLSIY